MKTCRLCPTEIGNKKGRPNTTGLCRTHAVMEFKKNRNGQPVDKSHWNYKEVVEYRAAHDRIKYALGPASDNDCVDCGRQARDWSLIPEATDVLISQKGSSAGLAYSLNVDDYVARCRSCHKTLDLSARKKVAA